MKLAVFLLTAAVACFAQTGTSNQQQSGSVDQTDRQFATMAAQANMAEVALGKLALQKSQNADVKKFAQRMVDDHGKAEQDLEGVASKNNVTLPSDMGAEHQAMQQRLSKLSGDAFDRAYIDAMAQGHTKVVTEMQKEANRVSASDFKDYATRTYPVVNDHLTMAKAIRDAMRQKGQKSENDRKDREPGTVAAGLLLS
jgi:putative membrane protein